MRRGVNNRPIQRKPVAYAKRKGRWRALNKALHPIRWLDANSTQGIVETCGVQPIFLACEPMAVPVELLVGDQDWDWSDTSEVRIDRLVGTMSWNYAYSNNATNQPTLPLIMRFGILATEDTDRVYQAIDLFDPESLEEFQWMWLDQRTAWDQPIVRGTAPEFHQYTGSIDIPLDVRTRRKLGKKDSVVLYAQTKLVAPAPVDFTVNSSLTWLLRSIIRS